VATGGPATSGGIPDHRGRAVRCSEDGNLTVSLERRRTHELNSRHLIFATYEKTTTVALWIPLRTGSTLASGHESWPGEAGTPARTSPLTRLRHGDGGRTDPSDPGCVRPFLVGSYGPLRAPYCPC
jgi:hypothetical protein